MTDREAIRHLLRQPLAHRAPIEIIAGYLSDDPIAGTAWSEVFDDPWMPPGPQPKLQLPRGWSAAISPAAERLSLYCDLPAPPALMPLQRVYVGTAQFAEMALVCGTSAGPYIQLYFPRRPALLDEWQDIEAIDLPLDQGTIVSLENWSERVLGFSSERQDTYTREVEEGRVNLWLRPGPDMGLLERAAATHPEDFVGRAWVLQPTGRWDSSLKIVVASRVESNRKGQPQLVVESWTDRTDRRRTLHAQQLASLRPLPDLAFGTPATPDDLLWKCRRGDPVQLFGVEYTFVDRQAYWTGFVLVRLQTPPLPESGARLADELGVIGCARIAPKGGHGDLKSGLPSESEWIYQMVMKKQGAANRPLTRDDFFVRDDLGNHLQIGLYAKYPRFTAMFEAGENIDLRAGPQVLEADRMHQVIYVTGADTCPDLSSYYKVTRAEQIQLDKQELHGATQADRKKWTGAKAWKVYVDMPQPSPQPSPPPRAGVDRASSVEGRDTRSAPVQDDRRDAGPALTDRKTAGQDQESTIRLPARTYNMTQGRDWVAEARSLDNVNVTASIRGLRFIKPVSGGMQDHDKVWLYDLGTQTPRASLTTLDPSAGQIFEFSDRAMEKMALTQAQADELRGMRAVRYELRL